MRSYKDAIPRMARDDKSDPYDWLRGVAPDLESAKALMYYWYEAGQPDVFDAEAKGPGLTIRAMAHHLSWALEGRNHRDIDDGEWWGSSYLSTEYGAEIYHAFCENPEDDS